MLSRSVMSDCDAMDYSLPSSSVHGDSPGKNTGVGCHALLQGIFRPRDQTSVSCTAGRPSTTEPLGKPQHKKILSAVPCAIQ